MQTKTYNVIRDHIGPDGVLYSPQGEFNTREANPNEVAHLVPQTLAEKPGEDADAPNDAKKAPAKKAATAAPENKAETPEAKKEA